MPRAPWSRRSTSTAARSSPPRPTPSSGRPSCHSPASPGAGPGPSSAALDAGKEGGAGRRQGGRGDEGVARGVLVAVAGEEQAGRVGPGQGGDGDVDDRGVDPP